MSTLRSLSLLAGVLVSSIATGIGCSRYDRVVLGRDNAEAVAAILGADAVRGGRWSTLKLDERPLSGLAVTGVFYDDASMADGWH